MGRMKDEVLSADEVAQRFLATQVHDLTIENARLRTDLDAKDREIASLFSQLQAAGRRAAHAQAAQDSAQAERDAALAALAASRA